MCNVKILLTESSRADFSFADLQFYGRHAVSGAQRDRIKIGQQKMAF